MRLHLPVPPVNGWALLTYVGGLWIGHTIAGWRGFACVLVGALAAAPALVLLLETEGDA